MVFNTLTLLAATAFSTYNARTTFGKCINFTGQSHQDIDQPRMMGDWYTKYADKAELKGGQPLCHKNNFTLLKKTGDTSRMYVQFTQTLDQKVSGISYTLDCSTQGDAFCLSYWFG